MIGSHGLCGCATCYALGYVIPIRDWVLRRISLAEWNGMLRLEGTNLNCAPGAYGREFTWLMERRYGAEMDRRYDCSSTEITPEALDVMERWNIRQEVR